MIGIPESDDRDMNTVIHLIGALGQVMRADPIIITQKLGGYLFSADEINYIVGYFSGHRINALLAVAKAAAVVSSQRNGPYLMADMDATMKAESDLRAALSLLPNTLLGGQPAAYPGDGGDQ